MRDSAFGLDIVNPLAALNGRIFGGLIKPVIVMAIAALTAPQAMAESSMPASERNAFKVVEHVGKGPRALTGEWGMRGLCTGSIVRIENQLFEVTAAHCAKDPEQVLRFGVNQTQNKSLAPAAFEIRLQPAQSTLRFDVADLALTALDARMSERLMHSKLEATSILELRSKPLGLNEAVTIVGNGGGVGPQTLACRYLGDGVVATPFVQQGGLRYFTPAAALTCELPLDANGDGVIDEHDIIGFSGSPVLDSSGLLVGVVSQTSLGAGDVAKAAIEIAMTPTVDTKLLRLGNGAMLVPRARVIDEDFINLEGFRKAAQPYFDTHDLRVKICFDKNGLPLAYQMPFDGHDAIAFVQSELGLRENVSGIGGARKDDSIEVYDAGGAIDNGPMTRANFENALKNWKAKCER